MLAFWARSRPFADLRSEITRTIWTLGSLGVLLASMRAWRLVPEPEMRTVIRVGGTSEVEVIVAEGAMVLNSLEWSYVCRSFLSKKDLHVNMDSPHQ